VGIQAPGHSGAPRISAPTKPPPEIIMAQVAPTVPEFAEKVEDIDGHNVDPPKHAVGRKRSVE
jgi:hypothetical protein